MTVAKMGLVICDMIEGGLVQAIVSTGALMAHGFVEASGLAHYKYREGMDDAALYDRGYNRVYDTLEPESNLEHVEQILWAILEQWDTKETLCSQKLNDRLGAHLVKHHAGTPRRAQVRPCGRCARLCAGVLRFGNRVGGCYIQSGPSPGGQATHLL